MTSLEIFGQELPLPDPVSVASLASAYRRISVNVATSKDRLDALRAHAGWQIWQGPAADAFAATLGTLPGQLDQAWRSFTTVAESLANYATGLESIVARVRALKEKADVADSQLKAAINSRGELASLAADFLPFSFDARVQNAQAEVDELKSQLSSMLAELQQLSDECVARIHQAQEEGIQNNLFTWFERYIVDDVLKPLLTIDFGLTLFALDVLYKAFVKPLIELPGDVIDVLEHPSFHTLGIALGDVGSMLSVVALVVAAMVPGPDAVAIPAAAVYLRGIAVGAETASFGSNTIAALLHEPGATWGEAGRSALTVVGDGVGARLEGESAQAFVHTGVTASIASNTVGQLGSIPHVAHEASNLAAITLSPAQPSGLAPGLLPVGATAALNFIGTGLHASPADWIGREVAFGL